MAQDFGHGPGALMLVRDLDMTTPTRPVQASLTIHAKHGFQRSTDAPFLPISEEVRQRLLAGNAQPPPHRKPPSQRQVRITDRDRHLLLHIWRFGCADITHIHALTGAASKDAAYRVIQRLTRAGYVTRHQVSDAARDKCVWVVTAAGRKMLLRKDPSLPRLGLYRPASSAQVKHRLRVLDVWLHYRSHPAYADADWWCDRDFLHAAHPRNRGKQTLRAPAVAWSARHPTGSPHRPDLVFVLKEGRAVAVEVELSAKTVAGYLAILGAYGASGFAGVHYWTPTTTIATRLTTARTRIGMPEHYLVVSALP